MERQPALGRKARAHENSTARRIRSRSLGHRAGLHGDELELRPGGARVELTAEDLRIIEEGGARLTIQGARYPEAVERMTGL